MAAIVQDLEMTVGKIKLGVYTVQCFYSREWEGDQGIRVANGKFEIVRLAFFCKPKTF